MAQARSARNNAAQMVSMPTPEEIEALRLALAEATQRNDALAGEMRVLRTERDLLKEQLNKFKRQLFAASSEAAAGQQQKDMFFNEAEGEGSTAEPAGEEHEDDKIDVPGHKRAKRGRKPLDPALPREVVRHELPEGERTCPHDGAALREIGVEVSEQLCQWQSNNPQMWQSNIPHPSHARSIRWNRKIDISLVIQSLRRACRPA